MKFAFDGVENNAYSRQCWLAAFPVPFSSCQRPSYSCGHNSGMCDRVKTSSFSSEAF